jgi:prepilin-type processing-associated H-X9-DG protein
MPNLFTGGAAMARKSKARGRKRLTKDLAPRRQAKGGKGEVTGLEPQQSQARSRHTNGVNVLMADGSVRFL